MYVHGYEATRPMRHIAELILALAFGIALGQAGAIKVARPEIVLAR